MKVEAAVAPQEQPRVSTTPAAGSSCSSSSTPAVRSHIPGTGMSVTRRHSVSSIETSVTAPQLSRGGEEKVHAPPTRAVFNVMTCQVGGSDSGGAVGGSE